MPCSIASRLGLVLLQSYFVEFELLIIQIIILITSFSASPALLSFKLQGYSGFDPTLCYGDILLSYVWVSNRPNQQNIDSSKKGAEETVKIQPILSEDAINRKPHDFIRTHFHRATHCDFCTKKVCIKNFYVELEKFCNVS